MKQTTAGRHVHARNARIETLWSLPQRAKEFFLEQAGTGLEKIVADSLRRLPPSEAPLMAWSLVCGSAVAERTRAVRFAAGVLSVEVANSGWKRELQALAPRYLAMINQYVRTGVQRIEFVIASDTNESQTGARAK